MAMSGEHLLKHLADVAKNKYGLTVWQWKPGKVGTHAPGSLHNLTFPDGVGRAFDAFGPWIKMVRFARHVKKYHKGQLTEGIFKSGVWKLSMSVKHGKHVGRSFWGSGTWNAHKNHIHIGV